MVAIATGRRPKWLESRLSTIRDTIVPMK